MSDVTRILKELPCDGLRAAAELLPLVYDQLRRLAAARLAREPHAFTLQPTALVHEAWLRLAVGEQSRFQNRQHFFAVAAEAMRRILVEAARRRRSLRRGGSAVRTELDEADLVAVAPPDEILSVDEAMELLAREDPLAVELVKLRYFVGLSMDEAASALGLPVRSAERIWTFAKAWLRRQLERGQAGRSARPNEAASPPPAPNPG